MHGCNSGSAVRVNAEVDSMGGVVDGGVGIGTKASPRQAAIEKAQAEFRQKYDVREERRRQLDFLEKGGNPLDFKFRTASSISVQSTSLANQHPEHFVTSEAKDSFALAASSHGVSVESSGRPGEPITFEPNSADNLLLFDGKIELLEGKKTTSHAGRRNKIAQSEQSSRMGGSQNARDSEDSAIFRPYARRNRSRSTRDVARSGSTDIIYSRSGHGSSLPIRVGLREAKGLASETNNHKNKNVPSVSNSRSASANGDMVSKIVTTDDCKLDTKLDGVRSQEKTTCLTKSSLPESRLDVTTSKGLTGDTVCTNSINVDHHTRNNMASKGLNISVGTEDVVSLAPRCPSYADAKNPENGSGSIKPNGFCDANADRKYSPNEVHTSSVALGTKGLDSESSCTQTRLSVVVNTDNDMCTKSMNVDSCGNPIEQTSKLEGTPNLAGIEIVQGKDEIVGAASGGIINIHRNLSGSSSILKAEDEMDASSSGMMNEVKHSNIEILEQDDHTVSEIDRKEGNLVGDNSKHERENTFLGSPQGSLDFSICEHSETTLNGKDSACAPNLETCSSNGLKLGNKAREDFILEEARIIQAKRRRIAELSVGTLPLENRLKSHWDFVLEEIVWLANDFAQERLWKISAAAQVCRLVVSTSRLRFEEQNKQGKQKKIASTLAKAVMQFWLSAQMTSKELDEQNPWRTLAVRGYAVRFLKYNSSTVFPLQDAEPMTPDNASDLGIVEISWKDHLTADSLFYTVPPGAMESYRKSIESHLEQCEKSRSIIEAEASMYDVPDVGYQDVYDEDEGETNMYYLQGASEDNKSLKFPQKKRKNLTNSSTARPYYLGTDFPYGNGTSGTQQHTFTGKRPANSLNLGSIPIKRIRTASRHRVLSPFTAGAAGGLQASAKTASSGDTNSFQDDQSSLQGGSQLQNGMEVESFREFEKHLPYEYAETSKKPSRKKKAKHMGLAYEQGWKIDSVVHNKQRDHHKKRFESHYFESNGSSGLHEQHNAKKPKIMKQPLDNTFDDPATRSIPSPGTSQISNMSNPSKFIKLIGRDRGRKTELLKMSSVQPGSGSMWSTFEDQALVVLVHDMGQNWELVSDAINSTVKFKCVFRNPKECKERHKLLMADGSGDGADSAEDSGSSQSYPSTLPGIPKAINCYPFLQGSATQLFQHLQRPIQEENLKSHFEKIISIEQKQQYWRNQNETQDSIQRAVIHNSHIIALSQVCPNNLNGGVLTPLDLCDSGASSPDILSLGHQGSLPSSGLAITNQGDVSSTLPMPAATSSLQNSSGMVLGSGLPSPPGPPSVRDGTYSVPRMPSLPVDEMQRMHQYNQMLSGRRVQQPTSSASRTLSGTDPGVRMLPSGSGMMCGMNRSTQIPRPGFQGMTSSSMLNSGSILTSSVVGMPSPTNMHSGPGQGNSMLRPREALHVMRPSHNPDPQRQMMAPELQMQVTQGNSQGLPPFSGVSSDFCTQTNPPAVQTYPGHTHQRHQMSQQQSRVLGNSHLQGTNHAVGSQQQAYAIRIAKERQMQQRYLQQQQFATSNALMQHVQPQPQLPLSPSLQNNSQIQSQTSQPVSLPPLTPSSPLTPMSSQPQHKNPLQPQNLSRNSSAGASALTSQMGKQRQRLPQQQQLQHSERHHPQQRQISQSPQQANLLKGTGRGSVLVHQNLSTDPSQLNGLSMAPVSPVAEKGEQILHLMQSQGLYSGSGLNPVQLSKPLIPPQSSNQSNLQQKLYSGPMPPSSKQHMKQILQTPSHSDNSTQVQVPPVSSGRTASHQTVSPMVMASHHQQLQLQPQLHQKQFNQTQTTVQRMHPQNRHSDPPSKSQTVKRQAGEQSVNNISVGDTAVTISQACIDPANVVPDVSSALTSHLKASEATYDSAMPDTPSQVGSISSPPLNSVESELVPPVSYGLGQMQLPGSLPPHGCNVGGQCQQHPHLQQSPTPSPPSQQQYQPQEQVQKEQQTSPQ